MKNTHKFKTILAITSLTIASAVSAAETISILYGFSPAAHQATTLRIIADEANKAQSKYNFIIDFKTGAGGSIAANHVQQYPEKTLVGMSSSFFIRPVVETIGIHDLDKFKPILVQATGAPIILLSKKYKNLNDLLAQAYPSIGTGGSIPDMLANMFKEKNPNLIIVNYPGMLDGAQAAGAGHIDAAMTFSIGARALVSASKVSVIGYTGRKELPEFPGAQLTKQGILDADQLVANYAIFASTDMPDEKYREIHDILSKAGKNDRVVEAYKLDLLVPANMSLEKSIEWYSSERQYWRKTANRLLKNK